MRLAGKIADWWAGLPTIYAYVLAVVIGIVSFGVRFWMLGRYAAPPSADHAFYLSQVHILTGEDVAGFGATMPLFLFTFLLGLLQIFDPLTAVRIFSALPFALLPIAFYALASRYTPRHWALLAAVLYVFNEGYSEMTGWGGAPDAFATSFMIASLVFLLRYLEAPNRRDLFVAAVLASLVVGSHHLTAYIYVLTVIGWGALEWLRSRSIRVLIPFAKFGAVAALASIPWVTVYVWDLSRMAPQLTPLWPNAFGGVVPSLLYLMTYSLPIWIAFAALAVVGGVATLGPRREGSLFLSMTVVALASALTIIRDNQARPLYYLFIPLFGALPTFFPWALRRIRKDLRPKPRRAVQILLVAFLVVSSSVMLDQSVTRMSVAVDWFHAINQDQLDAIGWIQRNTPATAVIATAGVPFFQLPEGTRYGWWIEALAERKSFYGGSPGFAVLAAERQMVDDANAYFAGNYVLESPALQVADSFPSSNGNPIVGLWDGAAYRPVVYLDDGFVAATRLDSIGNLARSTLFPPGNDTAHLCTGSTPCIEATVLLPGIHATRTEKIVSGSVDLVYTFQATDGNLTSVEFPVWTSYGFRIASFVRNGNSSLASLSTVQGTTVRTSIALTASAPANLTMNYTNTNPEFGVPEMVYHLDLVAPSPQVVVAIQLGFPDMPSTASGAVTAYDSFAVARDYRISYVFQDRRLFTMYLRFQNDPRDYLPVYANPTIVVYEFRI